MKAFLKNNLPALLIYFALLTAAVFFVVAYHRNVTHLYVNQYVGNRYINALFYYVTYLGDGRFAAPILAFIMAINVRAGIACTASFLTGTIISSVLKYFFFDDVNRPHYIFQYIDKFPLRLVDGVDLHIHNSFPSGHATQAFAILLCLSFIVRNRAGKLLLLFLALFTSFSRVYLSQHFLADITAGSVVGMLSAILYYFVFIHRNRLHKLDKPVTALKKA